MHTIENVAKLSHVHEIIPVSALYATIYFLQKCKPIQCTK